MSCLFASCFSCCANKPPVSTGPPQHESKSVAPANPPHSQVPPAPGILLRQIVPPSHQQASDASPPTVRPPAPYQVITSVAKEEIKVSDTMPEPADRGTLKYSCPLCFRYFSSNAGAAIHTAIDMLACIGCKNYVCRFCADDIGARQPARCPFCDKTPFIVADVAQNDPVTFV